MCVKNEIHILDYNDWITSITNKLELLIFNVLKQSKYFNLAISGGTTPLPVFNKIGEKFRQDHLWKTVASRVNIFWVDERPVSIDNPESNAGNAFKFLRNTGINLYPLKGDASDLVEEAKSYQKIIGEKVILKMRSNIPAFDLILLGTGNDGHIASLFPGTDGLYEKEKWVIANFIPQISQTRLTLTFPVILGANEIWMLCSGQEKLNMYNYLIMGKLNELPVSYLIDNFKPGIKWFLNVPDY